jgi:hypothetical protein
MTGRWARLVVLPLLLAGCSLPLPREVHTVGDVAAGGRQGGPLQVIPPGPRVDASPTETVLGFLGAQADSDGGHAIARDFLAPEEAQRWRDDTEVLVYDPDRLEVAEVAGGSAARTSVRVTSLVTGGVRADGSFVLRRPAEVVETYGLTRVRGQWRLDTVPDGLRLTAADRQRSFAPVPVYYLALPGDDNDPHLVPDQVFLPVGGNLAATLVARLLRAPSEALGDSVRTAVPSGARLRQPVGLNAAGVVSVDLTGVAARPTGRAAEDLSAQVVWTLRALGSSFHSLRLLVDGTPLALPSGATSQDADAWGAYDPEGLGPKPPYFYVSGRRLRASIDLPAGPATVGEAGAAEAVPVDEVAVTPDRARLALVEHDSGGRATVRIGAVRGTSYPVVASGQALTSPSWGAGQLGLWMVRDGRELVRFDGGVSSVRVVGLPAGRLGALALSRDGVRVALAVAGHLYVGRLDLSGAAPVVVGLVEPQPALREVADLAWASSTELVALGSMTRTGQLVRVAVDGSATSVLDTAGLTPTAVAASPAGILVVSGSRLYVSAGGGFRLAQTDRVSGAVFPG